MDFGRALVIAWCCSLFWALPTQVQAQTRTEDVEPDALVEPPEYREVVATALAEYEAGNFEESRTLMLRAHALFPSARTLRGLGMVAFELRSYAESVRFLGEALASRARPLDGALRVQTEELLARARSFTGQLTLELVPEDAQLLVDGTVVPPEQRTALRLSIGEHVLEARADAYLPERRILRVVGGQAKTVRLTLVPLTVGPMPSSTPATDAKPVQPPAAPERRVWYRNPWFWVSTGVAIVAGAATATTLALKRRNESPEPPYMGLSGEPPLVGPSR